MNIKSSFLILLLFWVVSSCTIEKRHYASGFYMEWNAGKKGRIQEEIAKRSVPMDTPYVLVADAGHNEQLQPAIIPKLSVQIKSKPSLFYKSVIKKVIPVSEKFNSYIVYKPKASASLDEKVLNGWSLASFILMMLGFTLLFSLIGSTAAISGILLIIIAAIMAATSLESFRKFPGKYWGKGFAKTTLIIGLIFLILFFALLILVLIFPDWGK